MVAKEIDKRTIYNLLARPDVAAAAISIGKWAGTQRDAVDHRRSRMGAWARAAVARARPRRSIVPAIAQGVYFAGLELSVVTAIAVMFSAVSTPVLSALYTIGLFVAGQWSYDLRSFADKFPPAIARACQRHGERRAEPAAVQHAHAGGRGRSWPRAHARR